jgi:hypothetical protein
MLRIVLVMLIIAVAAKIVTANGALLLTTQDIHLFLEDQEKDDKKSEKKEAAKTTSYSRLSTTYGSVVTNDDSKISCQCRVVIERTRYCTFTQYHVHFTALYYEKDCLLLFVINVLKLCLSGSG